MRLLLLLLATSVVVSAQSVLIGQPGTPGLLPGEPTLCTAGVSGASETERRQYFADGEPSFVLHREEQCSPAGLVTSVLRERTDLDGARTEASRLDLTYDAADRLVRVVRSGDRDGAWVPVWREASAYDAAGRRISFLSETKDYDGRWRPFVRTATVYDGAGRVEQSTGEEWDWNEHQSYYGTRLDRTVSGAVTIDVRSSRPDTTRHWSPRTQHETRVDESGRPVLIVYSDLGADTAPIQRFLYEYPATGDTVQTSQRREGDGWVNVSQTQTVTSADGRTRVATVALWNVSQSEWSLVDRQTNQFDEAGRLVERIYEDRDFVNGGVFIDRRDRWSYTASGQRDVYTIEFWIAENNAWGLQERDRREYDSEGRIVVSEFVNRVARSGQLVSGQLVETAYETDGRLASQVSYNRPERGWQLSSRSTFIHGAPVAADPSTQSAFDLAVWPNPTRGTVRVQIQSSRVQPVRVEVLDVLGRRVALAFDGRVTDGSVEIPISVASLAPGRYTIRLLSDEDMVTRPLTVVQ